jgi:hypothetical protein
MKIIALMLVLAAIAFGDTPFKGSVTDSSDTPISAAMVLIHWDSAGSTAGLTTNVGIKEDLVIRTNGDGIFVAAKAFSPTCRKIRMKRGDGLEVTLRMNADPLYTAEMGNGVEPIPPKH